MSDGPFMEVVKEADAAIASGATVFQKFTCLACLARQVMDTPNVFYTTGKCDECGFVTDLKTAGCGFMLIASADPDEHQEFVSSLTESIRNAQPKNRN